MTTDRAIMIVFLRVNELFVRLRVLLCIALGLRDGFSSRFASIELGNDLRADTIQLLFGKDTEQAPCQVQ